jgi:hypothetical protein
MQAGIREMRGAIHSRRHSDRHFHRFNVSAGHLPLATKDTPNRFVISSLREAKARNLRLADWLRFLGAVPNVHRGSGQPLEMTSSFFTKSEFNFDP